MLIGWPEEDASKPKFINFPPCFLLTEKHFDASSLIRPDIFRSCCWTVSLNLEKLIVVLCLLKWLQKHSLSLSFSLNVYSVANKICFAQKVMILGFRKVIDPRETGKNVRKDVYKNKAGGLRSLKYSVITLSSIVIHLLFSKDGIPVYFKIIRRARLDTGNNHTYPWILGIGGIIRRPLASLVQDQRPPASYHQHEWSAFSQIGSRPQFPVGPFLSFLQYTAMNTSCVPITHILL